ncbi:hypothetical protein C8Q80DRAFT_1346060, partial [Daedaleopsis nitida]
MLYHEALSQVSSRGNGNVSISEDFADMLAVYISEPAGDFDWDIKNIESYVIPQVIEVALSSILFGLYSILALVAIYVLCRRGLKNTPRLAMFLAIMTLYTSTTVYWAVTLWQALYQLRALITDLSIGISDTNSALEYWAQIYPGAQDQIIYHSAPGYFSDQWEAWNRQTQNCIGTASLTVNVALGDAIVWWRAWILWRGNRTIRILCMLLISATFATGVVTTTRACDSFLQGNTTYEFEDGTDREVDYGAMY